MGTPACMLKHCNRPALYDVILRVGESFDHTMNGGLCYVCMSEIDRYDTQGFKKFVIQTIQERLGTVKLSDYESKLIFKAKT